MTVKPQSEDVSLEFANVNKGPDEFLTSHNRHFESRLYSIHKLISIMGFSLI